MRPLVSIACLWPGLIQAWRLGSLRGLGLAAAFAAALNLALVSSFVWTRWPITGLPTGTTSGIAWVSVLGLWILGLRWTAQSWSQLCPPKPKSDPQIDDWFREAQHEYLKGHWIASETMLTRLLARKPADAEARLLLASVQRRSGARSQARQTLTELQPVAARWQWEIDAELTQVAELEAEREVIAAEPKRKAA
jgi:hypothetical protein